MRSVSKAADVVCSTLRTVWPLRSRGALPLVLHRDGRGWTGLEYERHMLSGADFAAISAPDPSDFEPNPQGQKRMIIRPGDAQPADSKLAPHVDASTGASDFVLSLAGDVPNVWQVARMAGDFLERLRAAGRAEADIRSYAQSISYKTVQ